MIYLLLNILMGILKLDRSATYDACTVVELIKPRL